MKMIYAGEPINTIFFLLLYDKLQFATFFSPVIFFAKIWNRHEDNVMGNDKLVAIIATNWFRF